MKQTEQQKAIAKSEATDTIEGLRERLKVQIEARETAEEMLGVMHVHVNGITRQLGEVQAENRRLKNALDLEMKRQEREKVRNSKRLRTRVAELEDRLAELTARVDRSIYDE